MLVTRIKTIHPKKIMKKYIRLQKNDYFCNKRTICGLETKDKPSKIIDDD